MLPRKVVSFVNLNVFLFISWAFGAVFMPSQMKVSLIFSLNVLLYFPAGKRASQCRTDQDDQPMFYMNSSEDFCDCSKKQFILCMLILVQFAVLCVLFGIYIKIASLRTDIIRRRLGQLLSCIFCFCKPNRRIGHESAREMTVRWTSSFIIWFILLLLLSTFFPLFRITNCVILL